MDKPAPDYCLVFRPEASNIPAAIRLRRVLKFALRACGLRCLSAVEVQPESKPAPKPRTQEQGISEGKGVSFKPVKD